MNDDFVPELTETLEQSEIWEIDELNKRFCSDIRLLYPNSLKVRGEISEIRASARGHVYLTLRKNEFNLRANIWSSTWISLRNKLESKDVSLAKGLRIVVSGKVDVWPNDPAFRIIVNDIDVEELLGELERRRIELIGKLTAEGLLAKNKELALNEVVTKIGLIASPGTQGYIDFVGTLERSPFKFEIADFPASVQGEKAPLEIANSLRRADGNDFDVLVLIRGGGAKSDLLAFDDEVVVRALASCHLPVFCGIGHTEDKSITDLAAYRSCITPTDTANALILHNQKYFLECESIFNEIGSTLRREISRTESEVVSYAELVIGRVSGIEREVRGENERIAESIDFAIKNKLKLISSELFREKLILEGYHPGTQLKRGFSILQHSDGRFIKSVKEVSQGEMLLALVADGSISSQVKGIEEAAETQKKEEMWWI